MSTVYRLDFSSVYTFIRHIFVSSEVRFIKVNQNRLCISYPVVIPLYLSILAEEKSIEPFHVGIRMSGPQGIRYNMEVLVGGHLRAKCID